jgi:hypothetical protein
LENHWGLGWKILWGWEIMRVSSEPRLQPSSAGYHFPGGRIIFTSDRTDINPPISPIFEGIHAKRAREAYPVFLLLEELKKHEARGLQREEPAKTKGTLSILAAPGFGTFINESPKNVFSIQDGETFLSQLASLLASSTDPGAAKESLLASLLFLSMVATCTPVLGGLAFYPHIPTPKETDPRTPESSFRKSLDNLLEYIKIASNDQPYHLSLKLVEIIRLPDQDVFVVEIILRGDWDFLASSKLREEFLKECKKHKQLELVVSSLEELWHQEQKSGRSEVVVGAASTRTILSGRAGYFLPKVPLQDLLRLWGEVAVVVLLCGPYHLVAKQLSSLPPLKTFQITALEAEKACPYSAHNFPKELEDLGLLPDLPAGFHFNAAFLRCLLWIGSTDSEQSIEMPSAPFAKKLTASPPEGLNVGSSGSWGLARFFRELDDPNSRLLTNGNLHEFVCNMCHLYEQLNLAIPDPNPLRLVTSYSQQLKTLSVAIMGSSLESKNKGNSLSYSREKILPTPKSETNIIFTFYKDSHGRLSGIDVSSDSSAEAREYVNDNRRRIEVILSHVITLWNLCQVPDVSVVESAPSYTDQNLDFLATLLSFVYEKTKSLPSPLEQPRVDGNSVWADGYSLGLKLSLNGLPASTLCWPAGATLQVSILHGADTTGFDFKILAEDYLNHLKNEGFLPDNVQFCVNVDIR